MTAEPMTTEELAAIRARSVEIDCAREAYDSAEDVPRLLAEVDRRGAALAEAEQQRDLAVRLANDNAQAYEEVKAELRHVQDARNRWKAERDALAARLDAAARIHQPVPERGQGYDKDGNYTFIEDPCGTCGTYDEYATPWPCATARALGLGEGATDER